MTNSPVSQKLLMSFWLGFSARLLSLLLSLVCIQSLSSLDGAHQRHPTDFHSEDQEHPLLDHADFPRALTSPAHISRKGLNHCHTVAINNWGFANATLPSNITHISSYTTTTPPPKLETPQLVTRKPDPDPDLTLVCDQVAGFQYARSSAFAATRPLRLLPNRTYVFSITSSTNIRSIVGWRDTHRIVARALVHSTKATIQFSLAEPADVYFTILWHVIVDFSATGQLGLMNPTPVGEVALFVVPGFAAL